MSTTVTIVVHIKALASASLSIPWFQSLQNSRQGLRGHRYWAACITPINWQPEKPRQHANMNL